MGDGSAFTVKEMLISISNKLDTFIETDKVEKKELDSRLDLLEQHKASINSNFRLVAWVIGVLGLSGIGAIVKIFML